MFTNCIFAALKKLFTHSLSVWLSLCILLASAGVPVFAHSCTMNSNCEEFSVLPPKSCCSENTPVEKSEDGCVKAKSCCTDKLSFYTAELPAVKFATSHLSIIPQLFLSVIFSYDLSGSQYYNNFASLQEKVPPLSSGRALLAQIQVFRI